MSGLPGAHPPLVFTREAVREVDRRCIDDFAIPGIVLMENAASALAIAALRLIKQHRCTSAHILAGPGNNGGDGFALARKLHNAAVPVTISLYADPDRVTGDAKANLDIIQRMNLRIDEPAPSLPPTNNTLLIDALLGTGLTNNVRGPIATAIDQINNANAPTLAIDIPSGLDCDTGKPLSAAVRATETVTFVGWKQGFTNKDSLAYTGDITVADIGAPIELVQSLGQSRATT